MPTMLDTIQELLDGAPAPSLDSLEEPLTTGYAHALALEGERLRLERDLRAIIRAPGWSTRERARASEQLLQRLTGVEADLRGVRT